MAHQQECKAPIRLLVDLLGVVSYDAKSVAFLSYKYKNLYFCGTSGSISFELNK